MSCTTAEMTGQFLSHSWSFLLSMSVHRLKLFFDSLVWRLQTQNSISPHPWIWYAVWLCHHHSEWQLFTAVTREDALQIEVFVPHDLSPELYTHTHRTQFCVLDFNCTARMQIIPAVLQKSETSSNACFHVITCHHWLAVWGSEPISITRPYCVLHARPICPTASVCPRICLFYLFPPAGLSLKKR